MLHLARCLPLGSLFLTLSTLPVGTAHGQVDINGAAIGTIVSDQASCVLRERVVALFVADATLGEIFFIDSTDGSVMSSFAAPGPNPQGLATGLLVGDPVGASVYVTDPADELIYHVSFSGTVLGSFPASGSGASTDARALCESTTAYDGATACVPSAGVELVTEVWIANGDTLCLVSTDDGSAIRSIPAPCASAQALEAGTFAGAPGGGPVLSLFVGCGDTIYEVSTADGTVINSFAAPGDDTTGLAAAFVSSVPPLLGPNYSDLTLTLWQGENVGDTMEELTAAGTFVRRIAPECAGGPGSELPWSEPFDSYANGSGLHGQGGWKGWDDDPAFDAVVTDVQARSAPHSVDITGSADMVHEFSGADSGQWEFTAWQYIPLGFFDPGSEPFDGSYFLLLNTYNDGGPYNWSVQMLFDSSDGMLKTLYGQGSSMIEVPYVTDRWVEIRVVIDLDTDWTRIYYDGSLLQGAEYSWTGGVFGEGGGALNVGAVDLYANGSTSVYYDDFILELSGTGPCNVTAVRSCKYHGPAGWLCLDLGVSGGIEPRLGGITELDIDLDDASGFGGGVTVTCSAAWGGSASVTGVAGNTVTVEFAPALPDQAYCTVTLDCGAEVCVRGLEGDVDQNGICATTDAGIIKPRFGQTPTEATARFDVDANGVIATTDFGVVKPRFGHAVPFCP